VLLHLHESIHTFLIHHILIHKVSEELEIELDHLEVN
jgi:hypothetical protein